MKKTRRLKRWVCFTLGFITAVLTLHIMDAVIQSYKDYYAECDAYYGHTTSYYTCRQYHINK
jgi:hypothetical protein